MRGKKSQRRKERREQSVVCVFVCGLFAVQRRFKLCAATHTSNARPIFTSFNFPAVEKHGGQPTQNSCQPKIWNGFKRMSGICLLLSTFVVVVCTFSFCLFFLLARQV